MKISFSLRILFVLSCFLGLAALGAEDFPLRDLEDWKVICHEGARGSLKKVGDGIYDIEKENAEGVLEFRRKTPVPMTGPARWFLRSEFQSKRNAFGTLFYYRLVATANGEPNFLPSGSRTFSTDTLLVNTPGDSFLERIYSIKLDKDLSYYPIILVIGNPAKIRVRNLYLTTKENIRKVEDIKAGPRSYTREQVDAILAKREDASCRLEKDKHGDVKLMLNDRSVIPVFYKNEGRLDYEHMFRNEDFVKSQVVMHLAEIPLCHDLKKNVIIRKVGDYDWTLLDERIYAQLQRAPESYLVLNMKFYEPYIGWGDEHPDDIWMNAEGKRGLGNNCHLKYFSNDPKHEKFPEKVGWWPSYSSQQWHDDYKKILADVFAHIRQMPYGKAIIGVQLGGGDDGQFQYRKNDYSKPALKAYRDYLVERYATIENLNRVWKSDYASFEAIPFPNLESPEKQPPLPFYGPGLRFEFLRFQEIQGWKLREAFAKSVKEGAGKPIITLAYGIPDAFLAGYWNLAPHLDFFNRPNTYPGRHNLYPCGVQPETSYRLHNKMWLNELDLRSWRSRINDELTDHWMNVGGGIEDWTSSHRKFLGSCFAQRQAWWYFSLPYQGGRFFDDPAIMAEIKKVVGLYDAMTRLPYRRFKPDVCLVTDISTSYCISMQAYAASGNPNAKSNSNGLQGALGVSGVPMDRAYLNDILEFPELQDYKVYVFMHTVGVQSKEREAIARLLKNKGRTIIWVYACGYVDENGKSVDGIKALTGFDVETVEKYERQCVYSVAAHPLNRGRREVMSYTDLGLCLQMPFGLKNIWGTPCQVFTPVGCLKDDIVAEDGAGRPSGVYRAFDGWKSLLLCAPGGLTPQLLNTVALEAGAYRAGVPGHYIDMSGNFASIHPLYDDEFEFRTPDGVKEVLDADTGKVIGKAPAVKLSLTAGRTRWLFMR